MSDRELVELAFVAWCSPNTAPFGWVEEEYPLKSCKYGALWWYKGSSSTPELWNPLTDDGDALRLAVKLGFFSTSEEFRVFQSFYSDEIRRDNKPTVATRRAIVSAAAEIGRKSNAEPPNILTAK